MTTVAGTQAALAAQVRPVLDRHLPGLVREDLVADLAVLMRDYAARLIEEHARPYPWPPPRRKRVDEGAAKRQQQQERKPA